MFTMVQNCGLHVRELFFLVRPLEISGMLRILKPTSNVATVLHLGS